MNPTPAAPIKHTLEKINNEWYVWRGDPKVLRASEALAGPFAKRYQALEAAHVLLMAPLLEDAAQGDLRLKMAALASGVARNGD